LYTNADGLLNKRNDLQQIICSSKACPDIIVITEIKPKNLKGEIFQSEFNMKGYQIFCSGLECTTKRGLLIYVKESISASLVEIPSGFKECIFVKLQLSNKKRLLIGNIYRSPSSSVENDGYLFDLFKYLVVAFHIPIILVGDFNFRGIRWDLDDIGFEGLSQSEFGFIRSIRENLLIQLVDKPTRQRGKDNPNILDLVITNEPIISNIEHFSPLGMSDHSILRIDCSLEYQVDTRSPRFQFHKGDYISLSKYLMRDWDEELCSKDEDILCLGDAADRWSCFRDIVTKGMTQFIPKSEVMGMTSKKKKYPFNKSIHLLIKKKHRLWNRWLESRDEAVYLRYKSMRNRVKMELRVLDRKEQDGIAASCKQSPSKFWRFIKNKSRSSSSIGDLKWVDGSGIYQLAETDYDKAVALEGFFSSVYTVEDSLDFEPLILAQVQTMNKLDISKKVIYDKLSNLKIDKSPGMDMLHPRLLFEVRDAIVHPLWVIFNESLSKASIPRDWKIAEVIALHKKGSRAERGNYRPVSLTCICCKLLESIIRDNIMNHIITNGLLSKYQYGFAKGRSTMLQLLHIMDKWTGYLEKGGQIDVVFTDFEKAFDKVPHKRLISKLRAYGIHPELVLWIEEFLKNRKYRVRVNSQYSEWGDVTSGIPQGSVLGPLLFVLYINDLPNFVGSESNVYLFADDAKLFRHISDISDNMKLQTSVDSVKAWSDRWMLKLNYNKCKVVSFGRRTSNDFRYSISDGQESFTLARDVKINDLGIILDGRLSFSDHVQCKVNKCFSLLGLLKRNFKNISTTGFVLLYKSMIRSQLDYCNSVWSPYRKADVEELEKVQKKATKCIPGLKGFSYIQRLQKCALTTLKFRRIRGDMIEVFKILTGKYDFTASPKFLVCDSSRTRGNQMKILNERAKFDLRKFSFTNRVTNIWNSLPNHIVLSESTNQFKNRLDTFWSNQEMVYDYCAELSGTGSRSEFN